MKYIEIHVFCPLMSSHIIIFFHWCLPICLCFYPHFSPLMSSLTWTKDDLLSLLDLPRSNCYSSERGAKLESNQMIMKLNQIFHTAWYEWILLSDKISSFNNRELSKVWFVVKLGHNNKWNVVAGEVIFAQMWYLSSLICFHIWFFKNTWTIFTNMSDFVNFAERIIFLFTFLQKWAFCSEINFFAKT